MKVDKRKIIFYIGAVLLIFFIVELFSFVLLLSSGSYFPSNRVRKQNVNGWPNNIVKNERYIWGYIPNSEFKQILTDDQVYFTVKINAEGFRDEEPKERTGARYRFIALGDSFTFGWGVEQANRWDEALARLIEEKRKLPAESINRGMWMSAPDQHALILEDNYLPSQAIIHLVYIYHLQTINTHVNKMSEGRITQISSPVLTVKNQRLLYGQRDIVADKSMTFPFSACIIKHAYDGWRLKKALKSRGKIHPEYWVLMNDRLVHFKNAFELMGQSIQQIADFARKNGIPYVFAVIPARDQMVYPDKITAAPQLTLLELCEKTKYAYCLDLLPYFDGKVVDQVYLPVDMHWTTAGQEVAATAIYELLEKNNLLTVN